jgi:DNA repair ATPase RecN
MSHNPSIQGTSAPQNTLNSSQIDYYQEYLSTHDYINNDVAKIDAAIHQLDIDHVTDPQGSPQRAAYNQERAELVARSQELRNLETSSDLFGTYSKGASGALSAADFEAAIADIKGKADQLVLGNNNPNASQIAKDVKEAQSELNKLISNQSTYQSALNDLNSLILTLRAQLNQLEDQVNQLSDPTGASQDLQNAQNQLAALVAQKDKLTTDLSALSSAISQGQDLVNELNLIGQVSDPTSDDLEAANALFTQLKDLSSINNQLVQDVPSQAAIDSINQAIAVVGQDLINPNVKVIQDALNQANAVQNNLNIAQLEDQVTSLIAQLADFAVQIESLQAEVAAHPENTQAASDLQVAKQLLADLQAAERKCQSDLDTLEQNVSRIPEIVTELRALSQLTDPTTADVAQATALINELKNLQAVKDQFNLDAPTEAALNDLKKDIKAVNNDLNPAAPSNQTIENATWYIDWTSWDFPVPQGVNTVNLFVGKINADGSIDGFGNMNDAKLKAFVEGCHAKGIKVKISIGGGGGSYDNCWDNLLPNKVGPQVCAQGLSDFCKKYNLDGVDFDFEEWGQGAGQAPLENLVGTLIKDFKQLNPTLDATLCTNAGTNWQADMKNILDFTKDDSGKTLVDRVYIMSYYDPIQNEKGWLLNWANWLETQYGFTKPQITVGLDDTDAHAYAIADLAKWAKDQGFSTGYWEWNPTTESSSNNSTKTIWDIYHQDQASKQYKMLNKA